MRYFFFLPLALAACTAETENDPSAADPAASNTAISAAEPAPNWDLVASGEGTGLFLADADGERIAHLFCPADGGGLLVNIPGFAPVASEERMSLGSGGTVVALVADPGGDRQRGGVSGEGPVPDELAAIIGGPAGVAVNYGYQNAGPFAVVPPDLARHFVESCSD